MEPAPERVHVAPLGVEHERIEQPAIEYDADRVVLLEYLPRTPPLEDVHEQVESALDAAGIEFERREANLEDLFDAVAAIARTIESTDDRDHVYVNVSSGNKVAAIAGMIASMTTGAATPYYVKAEANDSNHPGPASGGPSRGVRAVETIPRYPMDRPSTEQLELMAHVRERSTETRDVDEPFRTKKELLAYGERHDLPFLADYDGDTPQGKYERLHTWILDDLVDLGLVEVREHGNEKRVFLTDDGENTLRGFEYVVEAADR